jgi:hypothetical protein
MTVTLDGVAARKRKDRPEPTAEQKLAEELVARAREQGVSLTGPDGLLKQLTETVPVTAQPVVVPPAGAAGGRPADRGAARSLGGLPPQRRGVHGAVGPGVGRAGAVARGAGHHRPGRACSSMAPRSIAQAGACTSAGDSCGYSAMMSPAVSPFARPTTVATGIRVPATQGTPPMI